MFCKSCRLFSDYIAADSRGMPILACNILEFSSQAVIGSSAEKHVNHFAMRLQSVGTEEHLRSLKEQCSVREVELSHDLLLPSQSPSLHQRRQHLASLLAESFQMKEGPHYPCLHTHNFHLSLPAVGTNAFKMHERRQTMCGT